MKSKTLKIVLFGAVAIALVAGIAFAHAEGGPMRRHAMRGEFMGSRGMGFPMRGLNLTDDQHAQIKQIFQNEKPSIKPLMQQELQAHQQMMQLVTSGNNFDQERATAIASQEAQIHIKLQVEHAKIASQMYQLLSSDQKAKVADMMATHQQKMQQRMQKAPPADSQ